MKNLLLIDKIDCILHTYILYSDCENDSTMKII